MTSKKLGALLRSVPPATAPTSPESLEPQPAITSRGSATPEPPPPDPSNAVMTEPEVPLQVLVPKHIRTQLGVKAAHEGQSLRALILSAIRSLGIAVTDAEISGKRGRRGA